MGDIFEPCYAGKQCFGFQTTAEQARTDLVERHFSSSARACDVCYLRVLLWACAYLAAKRGYSQADFTLLAENMARQAADEYRFDTEDADAG